MTLDTLTWAVAYHGDNAPGHRLHRDYYAGRHYHTYVEDGYKKKLGWALRQSVENLMPAVVSAYVDRLSIQSWGDETTSARAAELGLQRLANLVHTEAFITGNAFAITWPNPVTGELTPIFHRAELCAPRIDDDNPAVLASLTKLWVDTDGYGRAAIYYPDRLERFRTVSELPSARYTTTVARFPQDANQWRPFDADRAPAVEPHDFGTVPAVWWRHKAPSQYEPGVSVIADAIAPQDRLNKIIADAVVSSERIARPMRYIMNAPKEQTEPRFNPETGRLEPPKINFDSDKDQLLFMTAGPDADKILKLKNDCELEIARVTGVPVFYLIQSTGDVPSGESLRVLTSRLVAGVSTFQQDATPAWKGQLELLGLDNARIEWADPTPQDALERWQIAQIKKGLGYSLEDIIDDVGETDVDGIVERAGASQINNAAAMARAFRDGQGAASYTG